MNTVSSTPGFDINAMFNRGMDGISKKGQALNSKMTELMQGGKLSSEQMVAMQFEVGQYNAMMEALSSVSKSATDMMKNLAQRAS